MRNRSERPEIDSPEETRMSICETGRVGCVAQLRIIQLIQRNVQTIYCAEMRKWLSKEVRI